MHIARDNATPPLPSTTFKMPPQPVPRTHTRRREISPTTRALLCGRLDQGVKQTELEQEMGIKQATISRIYKRYRENKTFKSGSRGRPRKTTETTDRALLLSAKRNPKQPMRELNLNVAPEISQRTIRRRLQESNIKKWKAAERPLLDQKLATQRLEWALKYEDWCEECWLSVAWSDECSVERGDGEDQEWVFRTPYQKWDKNKIQGKRKSGAVSQMVWGIFAGGKKGPCVECVGDPNSARRGVTGEVYLKILQDNLMDFIEDHWIFMQDNARVHIYNKIPKFLAENGVEVMKWPPYSPDLNPIEHIWPILKNNLHKHYPHLATMKGRPPKIKAALIPALKHCWELIDPSIFENLARTMPNRVRAVIEANGWYTKY